MTSQNHNRVEIIYNAEHKPYLYGAVRRIKGDLQNQRWESPFIISKTIWDGEEVVYGTVKRTLDKIMGQVERLRNFQSETQEKLEAAGIKVDRDIPILSESELTARILDEQEELIEDILLTVSVNIRILSEIFPQKLKMSKVPVYDYNEESVGRIELSKIADLLVHNRYMVVKAPFVIDLISDERFMVNKPQTGLKINFQEYVSAVRKTVNGISVQDLVTKLWGMTKQMSASSNIRDFIFLTQNLYTLGGSVVGIDMDINSSPLSNILNRVETQYLESMYPTDSVREGTKVTTVLYFGTPRFYLDPDLDQKQIRIVMSVGSSGEDLVSETLVMDYEEFFSGVSKASGKMKLYPSSDS